MANVSHFPCIFQQSVVGFLACRTMATLLPSLSSDDEGENRDTNNEKNDRVESDGEIDDDFEFGGILGEDGGLPWDRPETKGWSYQSALELLEKNDSNGLSSLVPRINVSSLITAKHRALKRREKNDGSKSDLGEKKNTKKTQEIENGSKAESRSENESESENSNSKDSDSDSVSSNSSVSSENSVTSNKSKTPLEADTLKLRSGEQRRISDAEEEKEEFSNYFDEHAGPSDEIEVFSQLTLSRPFLRGIAAMGFTKPTPVQASVIPVALAGRDICASAQTGSGKTAAFVLPILERIYQRSSGGTKGLILTPTRELAAQCLGMIATISQFTKIQASLIVGGARNMNSQAAELRARPDIVVATPGRLLDHITNSSGVGLDDVEFLVLDECDRLLQLGFQEEVHELVKACPSERQSLLFSATLSTKIDELVKLSLKRPVRIKITGKAESDNAEIEVADRLEQEFVRVRSGNEGVNRQGMLLALLTRTFTSRTIVFFDTKAIAHRMMIICGLCGIKCSELHGDLTQMQRLSALEEFRKGDVDVLLATDLAARGLDIDRVKSVINYEMPSQIETYVHRIGRTARRGRAGKSCTLIGEGRRFLMKEIVKDAEEKAKKELLVNKAENIHSGIIRSRTIPQAVVSHYVDKIKALESHVEEVIQAEAVAKLDRIAEMEAIKAQNLIEHAEEIKSRPRREWFASNMQKESIKAAAAERAASIAEKAGTGTHRMTRKKKRTREAKEILLRHQEEMNEADAQSGQKKRNTITDRAIKTSARSRKRENQQKKISKRESSIQDEEIKWQDNERQKTSSSKSVVRSNEALGDDSLFDEDRIAHATKTKNSQSQQSSYPFRGFDPSMVGKKKPKKKSVHSFKSKSKYKRRR